MNTKIIAWLTGSLTLLMAVFSFVLSFNALADLAAKNGVSIPPLFPLVVEAGVVIFSLNALYRSIHGESVKWQWALIITSSFLAGLFNILHAKADPVSQAIAAMPSLFLLLSFETFLGQIKHAVKHSALTKRVAELTVELHNTRAELDSFVAAKQAELDTLTQQADELNTTIEQASVTLEQLRQEVEQAGTVQHSSLERAQETKAKRDSLVIEQRRNQLVNILMNEGDIGASALANQLNTSRGTVYSDIKALSDAGHIIKNGNGWEVVR
jgi:hypothetical protein